MKFIRRLLVWVGVLIVLIAVLLAAALTSPLQTWFAQLMLDRQKGVHGSVGSVSAGFGKVEISDVRLEADRWELKLPSLTASLPVTPASRDRNFAVRSLVAKGWILDLSLTSEPDKSKAKVPAVPSPAGEAEGVSGNTGPVLVQKIEQIFGGILGGWQLPGDVSLDGVELEGDVIVAVSPDRDPVQLHVIIKGGGLAAGHEGKFEFHVVGPDPWQQANSISAEGRLSVGMKNPRTFERAAIRADITASGGIFTQSFTVTADLAAERVANEETFTAGFDRNGRRVAAVSARYTPATHRVAGEWKIDGRESDLPLPLLTDHPLPPLAMAGAGSFESDTAFTQLHILGQLQGAGSHWGILLPWLERFGELALASHFDVLRSGQTIRFNRLEIRLAGARPVAVVRLLQPFEVEPSTGNLKLTDPQGDWLETTIQGFPLGWLPIQKGGVVLSGGDATGQILIRAVDGGIALRTSAPLTATNVAVQVAGKVPARELDLSLVLRVECGSQGWHVDWAPFNVTRVGRLVAGFEGSASRQGDADQPTVVKGKWNADLGALASQVVPPGTALIAASPASGDFSASVGSSMTFDATGTLAGRDPAHTLAGSLHTEGGTDGRMSFNLPLKIGTGKNASEIDAEGEWQGGDGGNRINAKVTGDDADLGQLHRLAAPLAAAAGFPLAGDVSLAPGSIVPPNGGTDREPFWGNWTGSLNLNFGVVRAGGRIFHNVSGAFEIEPGAIHLMRGQGGVGEHSPAQVEGSLSFDASAEFPYRLAATASINDLDPAPVVVPSQKETDPVLEGHFTIAAKLAGDGRTLRDLAERTRGDYHLTSTNGIIRLLRISVADAFPEDAPVSTSTAALDTAGSLLNRLLGNGKMTMGSGEKKLSPTAEAVLNFTSLVAELAYDRIDVTAMQASDGTINLTSIEMVASDERLTGAGQITWSPDRPLRDRPLSVDLKLGLRGDVAGVAAKGGLLGSQKDALGYTALAEPLHFGGSLAKLDAGAWHDVLAKAATRPSAEDKKVPGKKAAK